MAKYWGLNSHNDLIDKTYNSLKSVGYDFYSYNIYYAEGNDINVIEFLNITPNGNCIFYIINSKIDDFKLDSIHPYAQQINFKSCELGSIIFNNIKIGTLSFEDCEVKKLLLSSSCFFHGFKIDRRKFSELIINCGIKNLSLANISIEKIEITSGESFNCEIENVNFLNEINFQCITNSIRINNSNGKIKFKNSYINGLLDIKICPDLEICFTNTSFFIPKIQALNSKINFDFQQVVFTSKIEIYFEGCKNSLVNIKNSYFKDEINFRGELEEKQNIKIDECVFKELVNFDNNFGSNLVFIKSLFQKGVLLPLNINDENNKNNLHSSVWCYFKNQALSRNDNINALKYKRHEMNAYRTELWDNCSFFDRFGEKIVLFLNRISNNHGLSWGKGLGFTIISWLVFYVIFSFLACRCYCM